MFGNYRFGEIKGPTMNTVPGPNEPPKKDESKVNVAVSGIGP